MQSLKTTRNINPKPVSASLLALAGVCLLATPAAAAQKLQLRLGGHFYAFIAAGWQDHGPGSPGAGRRSYDIKREAEIRFRGTAKLDNGIKFGIDVQLEAETCGDQIDESYIFVEGGFGRFNIGSNDGAADLMHMGPPSALPRHGYDDALQIYLSPGGNNAGVPATAPGLSGDAEKLAYFTPRIAGLQFGISYTPDNCEEGNAGPSPCGGSYAGFSSKRTVGQYSDLVEIGVNFEKQWAEFAVALSGGLAQGSLEVPAASLKDNRQFAAAANLTYSGLTFGAAYKFDDLGTTGTNSNRHDWSLGLLYGIADWEFSAGVAWSRSGEGAGAGRDHGRIAEIAAARNLGSGITVAAGLIHYRFDDNVNFNGDENDGFAITVGTAIRF